MKKTNIFFALLLVATNALAMEQNTQEQLFLAVRTGKVDKADPQSSRDTRNILKAKIVNVIIQEKIDRIKAALPQDEWNDIDQEALHKALEIAIRRALESDRIKSLLGK